MTTDSGQPEQPAPWWGIAILYMLMFPGVLLAVLTISGLTLVWRYFDGSWHAIYSSGILAILAVLLIAYSVGVARQIYVEFVVPKITKRVRTTSEDSK